MKVVVVLKPGCIENLVENKTNLDKANDVQYNLCLQLNKSVNISNSEKQISSQCVIIKKENLIQTDKESLSISEDS